MLDRGDLAAREKPYEESLGLRNQAGEKQMAAETETALARASVEEGHAAQAETAARKLQPEFQQEKSTDDELAAGVVLSMPCLPSRRRLMRSMNLKPRKIWRGRARTHLRACNVHWQGPESSSTPITRPITASAGANR